MDLGPNSEEEEEVVKKKKKKTTDELAESVSDLIKIDTKPEKKQEKKINKKKTYLYSSILDYRINNSSSSF